jgi:hypothetical protein
LLPYSPALLLELEKVKMAKAKIASREEMLKLAREALNAKPAKKANKPAKKRKFGSVTDDIMEIYEDSGMKPEEFIEELGRVEEDLTKNILEGRLSKFIESLLTEGFSESAIEEALVNENTFVYAVENYEESLFEEDELDEDDSES